MAAETTSPNPLLQRKASRYRAQQRSQQHVTDDIPPPLPPVSHQPATAEVQDPLARSRSRYRQKTPGTRDHDSISTLPKVPSAHLRQCPSPPTKDLSPGSQSGTATQVNGMIIPRSLREQQQETAASLSSSEHFSSPPAQSPSSPPQQSRFNRRVDSGTTLQSSDSQTSVDRAVKPSVSHVLARSPPPTTTTGKLFPPPRPLSPPPPVLKLDGPPSSDQIRATRPTEHVSEEKSKTSRFGLFKRRRDHDTKPMTSDSKSSDDAVVVPTAAADAPVSAVNAGERRVLLECGAYKMMYPITPSTTPVDLIKSAATTMSTPIDVKSAVLLEYFGSVGVHRAIRRYEHIRDVMNSWDHDSQNSLLLIDPGASSSETELGLTGVPKTKPRDSTWLLYYSQSVGKWDKRIVHLKRDGQITLQKDPKKPNEQTNVCHLSDFDIYTPTQEKLKKKVKPPKKHCCAIKSQQKSSMFENSTNFVHFFCVSEKAVADDFHAAIQRWRSWYLVNVMGEGINTISATSPTSKQAGGAPPLSTVQRAREVDSIDSHYQLGTFSPLVDLDHFNQKRLSSFGIPVSDPTTARPRDNDNIPTAHRQRRTVLAEDEPLANLKRTSTDSTRFSATPLSRSQTQHRQSSGELRRTDTSQSRTHRPLVDLSDSHKQQQQQARRGRGYRPEHAGERGLISEAMSPVSGDVDAFRGTRGSVHHTGQDVRNVGGSRLSTEIEPFTGEGLLSQSSGGWGDGNRGRGVLNGAHAKGPMLEMSAEDEFARGSLLQQVERRQGTRQPVIDRAKTVEKQVRTGERF